MHCKDLTQLDENKLRDKYLPETMGRTVFNNDGHQIHTLSCQDSLSQYRVAWAKTGHDGRLTGLMAATKMELCWKAHIFRNLDQTKARHPGSAVPIINHTHIYLGLPTRLGSCCHTAVSLQSHGLSLNLCHCLGLMQNNDRHQSKSPQPSSVPQPSTKKAT